jgi:hypothetical protein
LAPVVKTAKHCRMSEPPAGHATLIAQNHCRPRDEATGAQGTNSAPMRIMRRPTRARRDQLDRFA